jgi:hypothetical protein
MGDEVEASPERLRHHLRRPDADEGQLSAPGGQIWPFHYLVRLDQPVVPGLSRLGERTQLYTSRGAGFCGPPLRICAPSEITLLTIRAV